MNTQTTTLTNFPGPKRKVNRFFSREKITLKDIEDLDKLEREQLEQTATKILKQLKGEERDHFLDKIDQVIPADTKSDIWEYNHSAISSAIANYMQEYSVMPTKSAIAKVTGLSRQTVAKHFNGYKSSPEFIAHMEQFKFMAPKILASVFRFAGNGDMRAARLYFEIVGAINKQNTNTVVNEQNNYIQINNTILSQENLKQLTHEQLTQIENIVRDKEYRIVS